MADVKSLVDRKIQDKKVMMFSKSTCPFCEMAKEVFYGLMEAKELTSEDYEVMELDGKPDASAIQDYLASLTGARTVPRVFVRGKFIGGGSEVVEMNKKGELLTLLKC